MKTPTKAVILAAGLGTRLRPLTFETPKPLIPLWGHPLLDHTLTLLRNWGVRDVLVNLHHGADALMRHLRKRRPDGLRITACYEPEILGTGGVLRRADWFLDDRPFWMINADIAADVRPAPFLRALRSRATLAALWLTDDAGPRTVRMARGRIADFRSPIAGSPGTYTFCGLQLLRPGILDFLPLGGFATIVQAYEAALRQGLRVAGVTVRGSFWSDLGTPADCIEGHARCLRHPAARRRFVEPGVLRRASILRRAGARVSGFAAVGKDVEAAVGAGVANSVLFDGVRLGPRAALRAAILGPGVHVDGPATGVRVRPDAAGEPVLPELVRRLHWPAEAASVEALAPRGSNRTFYRLHAGRRTAIAVTYSLVRAENALYVANARLLRAAGIPVPRVLCDMPERCACVLEDAGDTSLLSLLLRASGGPDSVPAASKAIHSPLFKLYACVLSSVALLHTRGSALARRHRLRLSDPFGPALYRWEHRLFADRYLRDRLQIPDRLVRRVLDELQSVSRPLARQPAVLLHRDLQSTNILVRNGHPCFIDFQGMRFGPAVYDMASLLCDPYVELPAGNQIALLRCYAELRRLPFGPLWKAFWPAAVQRLVQAIGAYARLASAPETRGFAAHIAPGLRMLTRALEHVDNLPSLRIIVTRELNRAGRET